MSTQIYSKWRTVHATRVTYSQTKILGKKKFGYDGCMKSYWNSAKSGFGGDGNTGGRDRQRSRSPQQRFGQYENRNNNSWGSNNNTTQSRVGNSNSWGGQSNYTNASYGGATNNNNNAWSHTNNGQANSYSNGDARQENSWGGQQQQSNSWAQQTNQPSYERNYSGQNSQNTSFQAPQAQQYGENRDQYRSSNGPMPAESYRALTPADNNGYSRYEELVKKTAPMPHGGMMGPQQGYPLTNAAQKPHLKALDGNSMNPLTGNSNPMSAHKIGSNGSQGSNGYPSGNKAGVTGPSNPMSNGSKPITNPGNPMALNGDSNKSINTGNTIVYRDFREGVSPAPAMPYPGQAPMNGYRGGSFTNSYDTMANNLMNVYSKENPEIIKMNPSSGGDSSGPPKLNDLSMNGGY
jgi:hypothetical protein